MPFLWLRRSEEANELSVAARGGGVNKNKAKVLFLFLFLFYSHTAQKEEDASSALGVSFVVGFVPREGQPRTLHWEEVH